MTSFYTSVERSGNNILARGYSNGKPFARKEQFKPTFYMSTKKDTNFKSLIGGIPLAPKTMDSIGDATEFLERYKDVDGIQIYGTSNYVTQYIQENWPGNISFDMSKINILTFDIEIDISTGYGDVNVADKPVTSISMKYSKQKTYHVLGLKDYDKTKTESGIDPDDIYFEKFDTEELLLKRFVQIWAGNYPDVVTGWNVEYFDIMYIITRIMRVLGDAKAKELSPWGNIRKQTREIFNKPQSTYSISGITVIDYMDAFKKFGYKYGPQESYKLDNIAHVVLGKNKLSYEEYGSLTDLYEQNPQKYLDYNLIDTQLVQLLEEETALLALTITVAYGGGVNYSDAFGTVAIWESTIYRRIMSANVVPGVKGSPGERAEFVGGYVKDVSPGMYRWNVTVDLASLYPHLMMQYNMSPETYIEDVKSDVSIQMVLDNKYISEYPNYSVAANGACFNKKEIGIIPTIIQEYYADRSSIKKTMLSTEQEIEKIKGELHKRNCAV